jgi:glutamate-1-semialdehyde 2,1-aminomutase
MNHSHSSELSAQNAQWIPGGVVSLNRKVEPNIVFVKGKGAYLWDADGNQYIDYHAAFAPYLLGHGDDEIENFVKNAMDENWTLTGSGTTPWEGRAAQLVVQSVPSVEQVQFTCTGSEATYLALRLARAHTGRDHIVLMQGGYNGWHDEVACNVMTPIAQVGARREKDEYPFCPLSAGMPSGVEKRVHVINFNDLESLETMFRKYDVACILSEPILQNIGIVKPQGNYWESVRALCDQYGVVWVMDEVKTGFRHALGGYQSLKNLKPDLSVFGKAIANGYPVGAIGGREELMALFAHPDPARRVLISGTYNAHPFPMAGLIATLEKLTREESTLYPRLEKLGAQLQSGLEEIFAENGMTVTVARQGSALCVYFMDHAPCDWHDIAENHDMDLDVKYRRALIEKGVYNFPLPTKQTSISGAHTEDDIARTLELTREVVQSLR